MKTKTLINICFWTGIASMFLWELSIIPIIAIASGIWATGRILQSYSADNVIQDTENIHKVPYIIIGIILGIIFLTIRIVVGR